MVVTVFGLGFVGLTTAVGFAEKGNIVYGVDIDLKRKEIIGNGQLPFLEKGLDEALIRNLNKTFFICNNIEQAILESDCIFFCVGTPYGEGGQADLTYLYTAIEQVLNNVHDKKFRVLVTKSTVPPSTISEKVIPFVNERGFLVGKDLGIANNPEFLREGFCWEDFINPDRIVIGVNDKQSEEILKKLYQDFKAPIFAVSCNTAEFIKYLSNTVLATLISYSNEMSVIAEVIGDINISEAFKILHMDHRWGGCKMTSYLYPGCGYGGYCLPKDTNAIYSLVETKGYDAKILKNVIKINNDMPSIIFKRISKVANKEDKIAILGLAFKPNSDDVRDTPAAKIIRELKENGYHNITGYDPVAIEEFRNYYKDIKIEFCKNLLELIDKTNVIVITTAWPEFSILKDRKDKKIIDCRYML